MLFQQKLREYLIKILGAVEGNSSVVLVGGQCLIVWAKYYEKIDFNGLDITTRDIDILGNKDIVKKLENLLDVRASIPGFDDATPEVGVFRIPINAEDKIVVDVLSSIAGLNKQDVEKYKMSFNFRGKSVNVLNPVGMLKSRIANVVVLRRKDNHSLSQLKATIKIVNRFITTLLDGGYKFARKEIQDVFDMAEHRDGIKLYTNFSIDLLDAIPMQHTAYSSELLSRHFPARREKIERKRAARQ